MPEIASRHHLELANAVVDDALRRADATLDDIGLVAVTQGPGLVGALLVGVATAKGAGRRARPAAGRRRPPAGPRRRELPAHRRRRRAGRSWSRRSSASSPAAATRCWPASRTTTASTVLGRTLDDAAGEAFDKGARLLGLPFPGGPALERLARDGDPQAFAFPVARNLAGLDFSFAGREDVAAVQGARARATDAAARARRRPRGELPARDRRGARRALRAGARADGPATGSRSAAASPPTARCASGSAALGVTVGIPPRELCTDNAAMIASAARYVPAQPFPDYLALDAYASGERALA